jgi:hypothetical protein
MARETEMTAGERAFFKIGFWVGFLGGSFIGATASLLGALLAMN